MKRCRFCKSPLYEGNVIGACNRHQHLVRMERGDPRAPVRVRSRDELVEMGLLTEDNVLAMTERTMRVRKALQ